MSPYAFVFRKAGKAFGQKVLLEGATLTVLSGARVGIVGPNGAGKSTLLLIMAGREQPTWGEAFPAPGISVGILEQEPPLNDETDVRGNVEEAVAEARVVFARYEWVSASLAIAADDEQEGLLEELGQLSERLDQMGAWDLDARVEQAMDALACPPPHTPLRLLSGGERRRVALCRLLLSQPELLLLDEPTTHLDARSTQWLEQHLACYPGTVVAVTHDRYFLDNVAHWVLELDGGRAHVHEGNYTTYLETKSARMKVEGAKDAARHRRLVQELEWVRSSPRVRHAKSRARLACYEQPAAEADGVRKVDSGQIQIPPGPRLGSLVITATHLTKGFGNRLLIDDLSFSVPRSGIVGVIGPNGVGKTTLFRMIVGQEKPDAGTLCIGETVKFSYVDQDRAGLDPTRTVWEAVAAGEERTLLGGRQTPSRAWVATFGFKGADQQKTVGSLSGGELSRLNLALTLKSAGNVLLLDEPTNDLDVETLAGLESALLDFPGCALITTHDRWFLDRVATHILAWEGDAAWFWFEGNHLDYEAGRMERLGGETGVQLRVAQRKLLRGP